MATKKENFNAIATILNGIGNHDFDDFLAHEIELISRKRSTSTKPTKRQLENQDIKVKIADVLTDKGQTVTEILETLNIKGLSNQRVSALLRQMIDENIATKEIVKGRAMFTIA